MERNDDHRHKPQDDHAFKQNFSAEKETQANESQKHMRGDIRQEIATGSAQKKRAGTIENAPIGKANAQLQEEQHAHQKDKIFFFGQKIQTSFGGNQEKNSNSRNSLHNPNFIQNIIQNVGVGPA
jgi:hypothetical protein